MGKKMNESRHIKKESFLKSLEKSLGVVTVACKKADIPRSTYYKWLKEDEARKAREAELRELNEQLVAESRNMNNGQKVNGETGWYFYNANTRSSGISSFVHEAKVKIEIKKIDFNKFFI